MSDFSELIKALADKAQKTKANVATEEATKTALVMPFIRALGYDVFNPLEVVPEFIADIAGKKGERVDYAIMQDGKPIMIIECKCCGVNLDDVKREQLHSYFLALDSSIGILTDGIRYLFFSTAEDGKNMDTRPFMEFHLENIDPTLLPELQKLRKGEFDLVKTRETINELKFNRQIKIILAKNLAEPGEEFIRFFMSEAGVKATAKAREQFICYVKRAFSEFITEQMNDRWNTAMAAGSKKEEEPQVAVPAAAPEPEITENEWQALYLVKSILMGTVDADRIYLRNRAGTGKSTILLDDSNKKSLVQLLFHVPDKMSVEIGQNKEKQSINKVDDLLQHSEAIKATACIYLSGKTERAYKTEKTGESNDDSEVNGASEAQ